MRRLTHIFGTGNVFIEIQRHLLRGEKRLNEQLVQLASVSGLPLLATNGVAYARPWERKITGCVYLHPAHTTLDRAGQLLSPNQERFLKDNGRMEAILSDLPEAIANTERLANEWSLRWKIWVTISLLIAGWIWPEMGRALRAQAYAGAETVRNDPAGRKRETG